MGNEWQVFRLGDICTKIGSGATPRGGSAVYLDSGQVALIRSQNIYNDGFRKDGLVYISEKHAAELANVELRERDVLLNITGDSVARACMVVADVLPARVNQHVAIIRPNPHVLLPEFLRYYLVSPDTQAKLLSWAGAGGTRKALTKGMIESFEVLAPSDITEQRAIAHILGTLDDKIETLRRMNETLEGIARALFKAWFVDFEPVRAKMSGRWRRGQSLPGLPADLYDLFPVRLVPSELGEIPEGWKVRSILAYAQRLSGGTPKTSVPEYWGGKVKWVSAKDVRMSQGGFIIDTEKTITTQGLDHSSAKVLPANITVVTARGTVGSYCLLAEPMTINQTNYGLKTTLPVGDYFVFFALANLVEWLKQSSYGTIFDTITTKTLENSQTIFPGYALVEQFEQQVSPMLDQMKLNTYQARTLADLRDALLPQLISGRLRVREAEKFLEKRA